MKKCVADLLPGEKFQDSFGYPIEVIKVEPQKMAGVPGSPGMVRVFMVTPRGTKMYQNFRAEREVETFET